ncbi:helicase-related protein [Actinotalea sp. Marseille-Q4924]|uniref:helicase-related protein n=1 Tax=Actinotalea sp. Marseille-Q4924 TaxID=2866571 RepID=UPI001CE44CAA|nr:helicase-related protein [Actinotalea sp. Marseille-Q4924]
MSSLPFDTDDLTDTFGYFPLHSAAAELLQTAVFDRLLVIARSVPDVVHLVDEARLLLPDSCPLPDGAYWFAGGLDPTLAVVVDAGTPEAQTQSAAPSSLPDDHPLVAALSWGEHLWEQAYPIAPPRYAVNEALLTVPAGRDAIVQRRRFTEGTWLYDVRTDGRMSQVLESGLAPIAAVDDPTVWVTEEPASVNRFGATLTRAKLRGTFANTLFSFRATRTSFRPYQFKPVLKLLQTGKARLLVADEVGLGKTIEAGLIWTELEARREADRVLVVCPSSLLGKWKEEMDERFGFELTELDTAGLRTLLEKHQTGRTPARGAYICSLERLRKWDGLEDFAQSPPAFDLVIVDEAHSMRNADTRSHALGEQLTDWADALVFLTATPINLRQEDLLHLLELLVPEDFGDLADLERRLEPNAVLNRLSEAISRPSSTVAERVALLDRLPTSDFGRTLALRPDVPVLREVISRTPFLAADVVEARRLLADLNTLSAVITRTRKAEVDDRKTLREPDLTKVVWTPDEERFYEEYVRWCHARADAVGMPVYFAMQMPLRLASACLPMARRAVLEPSGALMQDEDDPAAQHQTAVVAPHRELLEAAAALDPDVDSKFDRLAPVLDRLISHQRKRVLLFTFSRPTLSYLRGRLGDRFRTEVMHGGVAREERRQILKRFRAGEIDLVLANRVASEGLDFEFCSAVVNYDLPWNPMEIEQRIGRIDRIGQQEEKVLVANFYNEATIDERILVRVLDRIEIFKRSIGEIEPIINQQVKALQAAFDFTLTPEQREMKVRQFERAVETQRAGIRELTDASSALLVSNDVEIAGLEDDLIRTGRYVGQRELALLLDDWGRTDGAPPVTIHSDGRSMVLRGNTAMAGRVEQLGRDRRRARAEISVYASQLRDEAEIHLVLDQEFARTGGGDLLTATHPLVLAATDVPGHRHARYSQIRVAGQEGTSPGWYVVVLAQARGATIGGGDEMWATAVDLQGREVSDRVADLVLAGLAAGTLSTPDGAVPTTDLSRPARCATDLLAGRQVRTQRRQDAESAALRDARRLTITAQYDRRMDAIRRRRETARARGRGPATERLFGGQARRAVQRRDQLLAELDDKERAAIELEMLAVCALEVTP